MADQSYVLDGRFALGNLKTRKVIGDFYDATDNQTGKKVELLITQPAVLPDQSRLNSAKKEIEAVHKAGIAELGELIYINVLPDGRLFMVKNPVDIIPLSDRIAKGVIPFEKALTLFSSLVERLSKAASVGVFHREIGPSNVIVVNDNTLSIVNFGLAQPLGNNIYGDPWFFSPEQAIGQDPGLSSTIYSLGALFYYMVVGIPPFQDADATKLIERHRRDMPTAPSKARNEVKLPEYIDAVILKAMAKDAGSRYPNFESLLNDLTGNKSANVEHKPATPVSVGAGSGSGSGSGSGAANPVAATMLATPEVMHATSAAYAAKKASTPGLNATNNSSPVEKVAPKPDAESAVGQNSAPSEPAPAESAPAKRSPRRRKKGGFRETLWFKKGEEEREAGPVKADELMKVEHGTGSIDDQDKSLEERYRDGSADLSADDRRNFSVRTGQTGVFQAVKVEDIKEAEKKREIAEVEASEKRKKSKLVWGIVGVVVIAGGIIGGIFVANIVLYKEKFKKDGIEKMEELLKSVKPAPKPLFLTEKAPSAQLIAKSDKALKDGNFIPKTKEGKGDSASEYILSLIKLKDKSVTKDVERLKIEFLNYVLSRDFAGKFADNNEKLDIIAKAISEIIPNHQVGMNFVSMVNFYKTKKGKRFAKKTKIKHYLDMLPYYPQYDGWNYVNKAKIAKKSKKLARIVKKDSSYAMYLYKTLKDFLKKADGTLIHPPDSCALNYYLTLDTVIKNLEKAKKLRSRKLKKIQKELPSLKTQMLKKIHALMDKYKTEKNYRMVKRSIYAISRYFSATDKKALEINKAVGKFFPPDSLSKVSRDFVSPK